VRKWLTSYSLSVLRSPSRHTFRAAPRTGRIESRIDPVGLLGASRLIRRTRYSARLPRSASSVERVTLSPFVGLCPSASGLTSGSAASSCAKRL
jgi:hypothetical protein